jgi:hypothetical protein
MLDNFCHPERIFHVVDETVSSNLEDPYPNGIPSRDRMILLKNSLCRLTPNF